MKYPSKPVRPAASLAASAPLVNACDPPHVPIVVRRGLLAVVCSFVLTACGAAIGTGANGASTSTDYDEVGFIDMARILRETTRGREITARLADAQRQVMSRLSDMQAQLDTIAKPIGPSSACP